MLLPENLDSQFYNHFYHLPDTPDMLYTTHRTRNLIDALARSTYGESFTDVKAVISQKDAVISEKDAALSQKDAIFIQTIIYLYTKKGIGIEEIAQILERDTAFVSEVLAKNQLGQTTV